MCAVEGDRRLTIITIIIIISIMFIIIMLIITILIVTVIMLKQLPSDMCTKSAQQH